VTRPELIGGVRPFPRTLKHQLAHLGELGGAGAQSSLFSPALPLHRPVDLLDNLRHRRFDMVPNADQARANRVLAAGHARPASYASGVSA